MEVCTQYKMDMSDPTLGPDQKCKNCQNAKKLHNAAPQKTTPAQQKPQQQPKQDQVKPVQTPIAPIVPKPNLEPAKQDTKIEIKFNTEQKQDEKQNQLKGCDNFKLDMKDQAIGDAVKCLNCGVPKGQHNFQKQGQKQPPKVDQQQPNIVVEPPKQPIKQPQQIINQEQKPIQVHNNQPGLQLKQGEKQNLIIQKQQQHQQQDERDKQDDGHAKACESYQLDMTDNQIGDIRCKKCSLPKSVHLNKPATQQFVNRICVQPTLSPTQGTLTQIIHDAAKLDTKDPPSRQSLQPQSNKLQEESKPTFVQQIALQQQQKLQQKSPIVQKEDCKNTPKEAGKNTPKSHLQEPQTAPIRPSFGIQPPTEVKQQIPIKPKNDDFGQDDFQQLMKGVKDFNQANNLQKIAEDAAKKQTDEIRPSARTMMPPFRPGLGQPPLPKKNPLEEKQTNETIDALVNRPTRNRRRTEQQDFDF